MKKLTCLILGFAMFTAFGCASTIDKANKDAETGGKAVGGVLRVPLSASEGVAEGVAGESDSNPYNR